MNQTPGRRSSEVSGSGGESSPASRYSPPGPERLSLHLRVLSPFDDSLVVELPYDDHASALARLTAASEAQRAWREVDVAQRVARVRAAVEWFGASADEVALDVTRQMGKPLAQAHAEVRGLIERAEHMLDIAEHSLAPEVLPAKEGFTRRIEHVPLGVVLDVAAWNYPLLIAVNVVVPAVLAGNAVLLKHSARTPLCGAHFERAFRAAGLDDLVLNVVLDHATTAALIADPRIGHVAFTGSVEGGRHVHRAASSRFIDTGLELGGNDPAYVAADADLARAAEGVVDGACYNAGQSCCAVERVYVHESVADELLDRARALVGAYRTGDPLAEPTTLGPLASRDALQDLQQQVADACASGAELHVTYPLYRMGWITEAGGLQRTTADRQPDPVTGLYRRQPIQQ